MSSPTLNGRVFCHGARREVGGNGVIIGLPYSILAYVDDRNTSWAPSIHTQRIKPEQKAVEDALDQTRWLVGKLSPDALSEMALDDSYGNFGLFSGLRRLWRVPLNV
jgi:hypothetical protein